MTITTSRSPVTTQPSINRAVHGQYVRDSGYNSDGSLATWFNATMDQMGNGTVTEVRIPAIWLFTLLDGPCAGTGRATIGEDVTGDAILPCENIFHPHRISFTPIATDAQAPPATFTISGEGIDASYAMPLIEFYDEYGRLTASTYATAVASDGTSLTSSMPNLPYTNFYAVGVSNALSGGGMDLIGATSVQVTNGQELPPLPDPPPDECNPTSQDIANCENCCGVQTYWDYSSCRCYIP